MEVNVRVHRTLTDLLRLYGWPTETEKYIYVTEIFFHFAKGTKF